MVQIEDGGYAAALKQDPMETQEHIDKMCRLRDGIDETTVLF